MAAREGGRADFVSDMPKSRIDVAAISVWSSHSRSLDSSPRFSPTLCLRNRKRFIDGLGRGTHGVKNMCESVQASTQVPVPRSVMAQKRNLR